MILIGQTERMGEQMQTRRATVVREMLVEPVLEGEKRSNPRWVKMRLALQICVARAATRTGK